MHIFFFSTISAPSYIKIIIITPRYFSNIFTANYPVVWFEGWWSSQKLFFDKNISCLYTSKSIWIRIGAICLWLFIWFWPRHMDDEDCLFHDFFYFFFFNLMSLSIRCSVWSITTKIYVPCIYIMFLYHLF